jgi:xanthine dehydrogenase accessory factor
MHHVDSSTSAAALIDLAWDWIQAGRRVALATVVSTWGSAPRAAGSLMVVDDQGEFAGSVSGGCVEVAVIEAAQQVIASGATRVMAFGVSDEQAMGVGLACGGQIRVMIEPVE